MGPQLSCVGYGESSHLHWRGVTKGLAELTGDLVLRRKIDLLEQFRGDGDAARGLDLPQRCLRVHVLVEVVVIA